jgi:hypothetical protein
MTVGGEESSSLGLSSPYSPNVVEVAFSEVRGYNLPSDMGYAVAGKPL